MEEQAYILGVLNEQYSMDFDSIEFIRDRQLKWLYKWQEQCMKEKVWKL